MVTAENGTLFFRGASGRLYTLDVYVSDVVAAAVTINTNGAAVAGSPAYWIPPEDVALEDYSIVTGNTVAVGVTLEQNGAPRPGTAMRTANHLNTLNNRPKLAVGFPMGCQISARQF